MASNQQQPQQAKQQQQQHQQPQQQQFANSNLPASSYLNPQDRALAQRRRKSTLAGNGFFIDYSCTRRRSSAAAWQTRQAQAEQQYGQQFLRTYVSPVRYPRSVAPTSASSRPVNNQRGDSFCAGAPGAPGNNNGNSPISSPSRHLSFSAQPNQQQYLGANRLSRASYCPPPHSPKIKHHSLRLHSVASPASTSIVLDGSRKTSIFDPAGHSLIAPTLMAQRRRSTMITGAGNVLSPSSAAALAEQKSQSSAAMLSVAAKSAATSKSANKFRVELVQHVPVIGCSPTSIKASLAALDETKKYEKLLRKIKRHQKQKEKLKRKEREKRRKLKAKHMKFKGNHNYNHYYSGEEDEDEDEEEKDVDLEMDEDGDVIRVRSSSSTHVNQRKPSVAINDLRRKSIRAIKDAAQLIKHPQRSYKKRASHTEGLSISSISIADFDHSSSSASSSESGSFSQSPSKGSHYSTSSQVEPSVDRNDVDSSNSDDFSRNISSGDEYRYELNNDELFEDENTMVNLSRVARSASLAASNSGNVTNKQRASSYTSSKKSIVSKAMKKLAKTISNNSSDRLKQASGDGVEFTTTETTNTTSEQVNNETSRGELQQQQQESPTTNFSNSNNNINNINNINQSNNNNNNSNKNAFDQRRNSQATNGLNYWYYYYYLRENSADHAIDDLPISACTGLLSDSERKKRLHINYSLARIRILNSSKDSSSAKALYEKERRRRLSMRYGVNVGEKLMEGVGGEESMEYSLFDQHQNQEGGENLRPSLDSKLPFDFSQSTDISLALSSTTISSRSSSSDSSIKGGRRNSAGSADDKDFHQRQQRRQRQRQRQHQIPLTTAKQPLTSSASSSPSSSTNSNSNPNLNVKVNANINANSTQDSSSSSHDRTRARSSFNSTPLSSPKRRKHRKGYVARDLQRRLSQRDVSSASSRSRAGGCSTLQVTRQTGQSASTHSMNQASSCWPSRKPTTNLQNQGVVENNQAVEKRFSPIAATINCQISCGCSADDEATSVDIDLNRLVATFGASTSLSSAGSREFAIPAVPNSENKRKQSSGHQQQTWLLAEPTSTVIQSGGNSSKYCESRDRVRHHQQHQYDGGRERIKTSANYSAAAGMNTTSGSTSSLSAHFDVAQTSTIATTTAANKKNLASQQSLNQLSQPTSTIGLLNLPEATSQQAILVESNMSQQQEQTMANTGGVESGCLSNGGSKRSASFASSVLDNEKDELDDFERFKGSYRGFKGSLAAAMNPTPPMSTKTTTTASGSNKSSSSQKSGQKSDDFSEIRRRVSKYSKFRFSLKSNRNSDKNKLQADKSEKPSEESPSNTSTAATKTVEQSKKANKAAKMRQSSMSWDTLAGNGTIESFPTMIQFKKHDQQHQMQLAQEREHLEHCELQHGRVNRTGTVNYTSDRMTTASLAFNSNNNTTTSQHLDYVNSPNRLSEATSSGQIRPARQIEKPDQEEKEYGRQDSNNSGICEQHRLSASGYQQQRGPIRAGSDKYLNATTSHKYSNDEQQLQQQDWKSNKCQQQQQQQQHINHEETHETDRWFVCNAGCPVTETSEYFVGQPSQQTKQEQKINVDHYCDNNNHQQHLKRELEIQQGLHRSQRASLSCCSSEETSESTKNEQQESRQRQVWQQQQKQRQQQLGEQFSEQHLQREQTLNWDRCRARSHMSIVNLGICRAPETKSDCPELSASAGIGAASFGGSSLGLQVGSQMVSVSSNRSQQDWNEREMSLKVPSQQQQQHQLEEEITGECPICAHLEGAANNGSSNSNHNHRQQIDSESFAMKTMLNEAGSFSGGDTQLTTTTTNFQSSLQSSSKATTHILSDTKPGGGELCAVRPHSTGSGSETKPVQLVDAATISNSVTMLPSPSSQPVGPSCSFHNKQTLDKQQQQRLTAESRQVSEESSQRCLQSVQQRSLQQSQRQVEGCRYSSNDKIIVPSTSGQLHAPLISASSSMVIYAGQTNNNNKQPGGPFSTSRQQQHSDGGRLNNNSQVATNRQQHEQRVSVVPQQQQQQQHRLEQQCIMKMLKKNSFTCMLVGSRQSGKRSIVKCFVKLLNEFRLAVKEYRREKMLTRLMDCSERLQELQEQQEEQQQQQQQQSQLDRRTSTGSQMFTRSRINSWLAGSSASPSATKILNFPYKQRLNSVATPSMHHHQQQQYQHFNQQKQQAKQHYSGKQMELYNTPNQHQYDKQQRRRHTAIEQITTSYINNSNLAVSEPQSTLVNSTNTGNESSTGEVFRQTVDKTKTSKSTSTTTTTNRNFLEVESQTTTTTTTTTTNRFNALNKSDFDISYNSNQDKINNINSNSCSTQQLQVPKLALNTNRQSISFLVKDKSELNASSSSLGRSTQLLSPTSNSAVDLNTTTNFSTNVGSSRNNMRHTRSRNQSVQMGNSRRRPMLSLKELNKRRIRIRFRTRRQLNAKYLINNLNDSKAGDNNNNKELTSDNNNINRTTSAKYSAELPDSFMVVYSINDRKSFEYAKTIIDKIRSIKHDQLPIPVILVANKIDLERAKVVKSEEGKSLARKYSCKYMEISCTIGFNLDNLLVGIRTQLILKHHTTLNSILKHGAKALRSPESDLEGLNNVTATTTTTTTTTTKKGQTSNNKLPAISKAKEPDNILVRFYKRYMTDNYEQDYDCDNFSKL